MATKTVTISQNHVQQEIFTWATAATGDDGAAVQPAGAGTANLTATGTWNSSTLAVQGTNDGTNWVTVMDVAGTGATLTADGSVTFPIAHDQYRFDITGGTGTGITVTMATRLFQ